MELLCPSCQRRLTIDDKYAGQLMKCPLCGNNFTAPRLAPVPGAAVPPPPPAPAPAVGAPPPGPARGDGFPLTAPPMQAAAPPPPAPLPPPGDYNHRSSIHLKPNVLQWVVPLALVAVLVLSFFTWVRWYTPNMLVTQNGWQAAFGSRTPAARPVEKADQETKDVASEVPGSNLLLIFYLLLLILLLLLAVAAVVLTVAPIRLPPAVQTMLPWRWGLVGVLAMVAFALLAAQSVMGLGMEARVLHNVEQDYVRGMEAKDEPTRTLVIYTHARDLGVLQRTIFPTLVILLQLVAVVFALLLFWIDVRKNQPLPRLDVLW